jgi:hypothetical protein
MLTPLSPHSPVVLNTSSFHFFTSVSFFFSDVLHFIILSVRTKEELETALKPFFDFESLSLLNHEAGVPKFTVGFVHFQTHNAAATVLKSRYVV